MTLTFDETRCLFKRKPNDGNSAVPKSKLDLHCMTVSLAYTGLFVWGKMSGHPSVYATAHQIICWIHMLTLTVAYIFLSGNNNNYDEDR